MIKYFKKFQDLAIEGPKAEYYNQLTREHRVEETKRQTKEVSSYLHAGDSVLEVASGAGYLSIELAKGDRYIVTGMDISKDLVKIAKRNAEESKAKVNFLQGSVSKMPFGDNEFAFIICVLAFKNFKEPVQALQEMFRVLKPGGTVLIMDLDNQATLKKTKAFAESMGLKGFQAYIAGAIQRSASYSKTELEAFIAETKFKHSRIETTDMGFSIYLSK
jgi:ubiquinone/menaquinone biosynthesis C-methylase UbiE